MSLNHFDDLSGREFGIWCVVEFDHMKQNGTNHKHGMSYYRCKCKRCGVIKLVARSHLTNSKNSKHAGCKGEMNARII